MKTVSLIILCSLLLSSATLVTAERYPNFAVVFPLLGPRLSSEFGTRRHPIYRSIRHHSGVDLAAPKDSHVRVISEGIVIFADRYGSYGKLVSVEHAEGYVSLYGHLNQIDVKPGQKVSAGDIIGRVGETGAATGPHLHFEWRRSGKALDPLEVFPALAEGAEG